MYLHILGLNATCISDILAGFDNATRFVFLFCQVLENLSALPLFCFFAFYLDIALSQNGYPRINVTRDSLHKNVLLLLIIILI